MAKQTVYGTTISIGCDPEIFFTRKGTIIGAERVIPKAGLTGSYSTVVIDGVQAELHPAAMTCRQGMASAIKESFFLIHKRLQELGDPDIKVSFQPHCEVSREELDELSPESKMLGCQPSLNHYGFQDLGVDVATFLQRSAGGHLHFGFDSLMRPHAAECVPVLDAVLGNFCVMVDRDPHAAERRKVYGRAGEYRLPSYGLEYRTLSNFWLRAYPLQSMVMGIARDALYLCYTSVRHNVKDPHYKWDPVKVLLEDYVNMRDVQQAINTNDLALAKQNWARVKAFITDNVASGLHSLYPTYLPSVGHFLGKIEEAGLEYWFNEDPWTHWLNLGTGVAVPGFAKRDKAKPFWGWESFLSVVGQDAATTRKAA